MTINPDELEVRHNAEKKRFEIELNGSLAMVEYLRGGSNIIFTHTEVPPAFEGQGVGNKLAKFALDYAVAEGLKIQPLCPFISAYVRRHAEYHPYVWHK